jgi:N-acetylglucosaminyl-diphospho-decaprenol L-rhamnosyltransferase
MGEAQRDLGASPAAAGTAAPDRGRFPITNARARSHACPVLPASPSQGRPGTDGRLLTLVIATTNEASVLPGFLTALPAAMDGVGPYELVVADNGSTDGTLDVLRQHAKATVVEMRRNAGYAAALNAGIAAARPSSAVMVANPDIRFQPGSIRLLLAALAQPGTGIAVPRLTDVNGHLHRSMRREPTVLRAWGEALLGGRLAGRHHLLGEVVMDPRAYARPGSPDWASGAAMLISRPCLETVGPWDERFFLYSDETDFALRARDAGFSLRYVPDAVAVHIGGQSHASPRLWSILTLNKLRLFSWRHGRPSTVAFWAALAVNEGLRAIAGRGAAVHRAGFLALVQPSRRPRELTG